MKDNKTKEFVILTFFTALIILMAFTPFIGYIPLVFTKATTIHIPVIIGSIILGPKKGAFLGFIFGLTSFVNNSFISCGTKQHLYGEYSRFPLTNISLSNCHPST